MMQPKIVLASSSPYRRELLTKLQLEYTTANPGINESSLPNEQPIQLAIRLAKEKAVVLQHQYINHLIIGSDQVAMLNGRQLTKPGNRNNTVAQLQAASGKRIEFYTSICVLNSRTGENTTDLDVTSVQFRKLSSKEIVRYVDFDEPFNCAGGFKVEGLGIALFERIDSEDPNALIGLPLIKLINILKQFGVTVL